MIKQRSLKQHRRNNSEINISSLSNTLKNKKKSKHLSQKNSKKVSKAHNEPKNFNFNQVHSLIQKSMKKVGKKHVIVEDIQQPIEDNQSQEFFKFGKKTAKDFNIKMPPMEEIEEVPDTGSYSQRNTEGKVQNKQNNKNFYNRYDQHDLRNFKLQLQRIDQKKEEKGSMSHRLLHNKSKRSQLKSSRSHNCSQSTVELGRAKSLKSKSKSRQRQRVKTAKNRNRMSNIQKQITMIWQCMGDLWESNRITRKISQQNSLYLAELMRKNQSQDRELIQLKLKLDSKIKNT